ncbi:hypothetical protein QBC35DRAFT_420270 [Podospora australis]|uniref:ABM domain-containing protein n=1 Tax=Podospora australis TaxID=1536484 RepID=A0AAN7ADM4_9PEZI|nr:hypothetical protein QBC35DRAFT_420270 [Podospora australis]
MTQIPDTTPPDKPVDVITTVSVTPESKDRVEKYLIDLGKDIEANEPGCLQWEVFYLGSPGELVLIERFKDLSSAEDHRHIQYSRDALAHAAEQGWLSREPDIKILNSRGGFAFRKA